MASNSESIGFKQLYGNNKVELSKDSKGARDLSIKVDIDVSDALKGLKAVQREAKKTARVLREVEELSDKRTIDSLTDDEIIEVLSSRGWDSERVDLKDGWGLLVKSSITFNKNHKTQ